jgi:ABC-type uncharacterized transport system permease subunit
VVAAAVFVAGMLVGADSMSRAVGVPTYIADVIVAVALITMLVATLLTQYRVRWSVGAMSETARPAAGRALLGGVLRIATPLILGTLGVLLCERAGVLNLGIEGIMVAGAFAGWLAVLPGLPLWGGVAVAALAPARPSACCTVLLTVTLALSQHVAGLGITLLATSLASFAYRVSFPKVDSPPTISPLRRWLAADPGAEPQTPLTLLACCWCRWWPGCCTARRWAWPAHGGREPGRRRRPGPERGGLRTAPSMAGSALMGVAGSVPHAVGLQRLLLQHGQRPRLGLRGAGGVCQWRPGKALLGALLFAFFDALQLRLQQAGAAACWGWSCPTSCT